jgi:hypothetical protein
VMRPGPMVGPAVAIKSYFYGRGEQIFRINDDRENYLPYLRPSSDEERDEMARMSNDQLAVRLMERNAEDLLNVMIDRGTRPAITDFWSPSGRLLPRVLVPLLIGGLLILLWRCIREPRARFLLALYLGFSVPLVLTSQVHIGRLIYTVPVVALICAIPIGYIVNLAAWRVSDRHQRYLRTWGAAAATLIVMGLAAIPSWHDWETEFPITPMVLVAERIQELRAEYPDQPLVYVFGDLGGYEVEGLNVAELEMLLRGDVRFADLETGDQRGNGNTMLSYGAVVPRLADPSSIPGYCSNIYLVEPNLVDMFIATTEPVAQAECGRSLIFNELK